MTQQETFSLLSRLNAKNMPAEEDTKPTVRLPFGMNADLQLRSRSHSHGGGGSDKQHDPPAPQPPVPHEPVPDADDVDVMDDITEGFGGTEPPNAGGPNTNENEADILAAAPSGTRLGIVGRAVAASDKALCIACQRNGMPDHVARIATGTQKFFFRQFRGKVERSVHHACILSGAAACLFTSAEHSQQSAQQLHRWADEETSDVTALALHDAADRLEEALLQRRGQPAASSGA